MVATITAESRQHTLASDSPMRHATDPDQTELFSPFAGMFSEVQLKLIENGWSGLFRHVLLKCMPVEQVGEHFDPHYGVLTKELYGMIGLIVLAETFDWTEEETVHRYLMDLEVRYALNRSGTHDSMSLATLQRYRRILREDGLAQEIFASITDRLREELDLDVSQQRLDSTHVFSDMAGLGRTRLMGTCVKRFLTALIRHDPSAYESLPEELRERYGSPAKRLFGNLGGDATSRRLLRQQVAEDMLLLVERFADDLAHRKRSTFTDLQRCLEEQCEIAEDRTTVTIKTKTGGNRLQNPSDSDATYDGHKGIGYQAQCSETCSEDNEVQLMTGVEVETAVTSDAGAVAPMLDQLAGRDATPESLLADTAYGSNDNVKAAEERGVELVSPCPGKRHPDVHALGPDDIVVDEGTGCIKTCPAGEEPVDSWVDKATGKATAVMDNATCMACPHQRECPMQRQTIKGPGDHHTDGPRPVIKVTPDARLRHARQREECTDAFRERYRKRAGEEGTFSGIKRRTGLGRLRRRGMSSVTLSVVLKIAGWNILRAASSSRMRTMIGERVRRGICALISLVICSGKRMVMPSRRSDWDPASFGRHQGSASPVAPELVGEL